MNIDFIQAIQKAKKEERDAYDLYIDLSKKSVSENLKQFYLGLAMQELSHERLLSEVLNLGSFSLAKEKTYHIDEYKTNILNNVDYNVNIQEILEALLLAIEWEELADNNYFLMSNNSESDDLRQLFIRLSGEERNHKVLLADRLAEIEKQIREK